MPIITFVHPHVPPPPLTTPPSFEVLLAGGGLRLRLAGTAAPAVRAAVLSLHRQHHCVSGNVSSDARTLVQDRYCAVGPRSRQCVHRRVVKFGTACCLRI